MLRRRDATDAFVFWDETGYRRRISYAALQAEVSRVAQAMRAEGLVAGDRVAAFMPNMPETAVLALAAISIGAVWSCCSPDFGTDGVLDRFGQTEPKLLFSADGYLYNGKAHDSLARVREIAAKLPSVRRVVVVPHLAVHSFQSAPHAFQSTHAPDVAGIGIARRYADWIAPYAPGAIEYAQLPFDHPLYILFTSGTTGKPKCIVHGAGGTLLQSLKTYKLQFDVRPLDRFFYYTTCNWVMWNLLFQGLLAEASIMLYDGSPFMRDAAILFDYCDAERFTQFGTSAKFIDAIAKRGLKPGKTHRLAALRHHYFNGLAAGARELRLRLSRDQARSVPVVDFRRHRHHGLLRRCQSHPAGVPRRAAMPQPRDESRGLGRCGPRARGTERRTRLHPRVSVHAGGLLERPGGKRYHEAYFARWPKVWCHGDYCELTERGTMIVYGRSDATLNPGGVRIGTAEIYGQVEKIDEVEEAVAIGQLWPPDQPSDTRVVLFVKLRAGLALDAALEKRIRRQIRNNTTPRHVPARIVQVPDIPRTKNGKVVELAVKAMVHGMPVTHTDALANPEVLQLFRDMPELQV